MALLTQLLNLARFKAGSVTPICGPMKVQWELTYHCNLKCLHCHIWKTPLSEIRQNTLTLEQQKKIVDDLADAGVRHLSFSGGEMFLQKTVYELIAHAKSRGMKVGGNSNAFLINDKIARKIADSGLDMLYISLDGDNPATHDGIRGVAGAFDHVFKGVANLKAVKPSIKVFFNTTINARNVGELSGVAKRAREAGVAGLTVEMTNTFDKYAPDRGLIMPGDKLPILREQMEILFRDYADLLPHQREYFEEFETYLKKPEELYKYRCVAGFTSAQIHPNGDLYPCPVAFKKIGNLVEKPFGELWFSQSANDVRKDIKEGRHPICWVTCISPLNQYLSYLSPSRIHKLFRPGTIRHIFRKI